MKLYHAIKSWFTPPKPPQFEEFPKIPRLRRDIVITEKIDGTNATVYVAPNGAVYAGSKNRWITPEEDNHGFAKWVADHASELRALGPGMHRGEWWGKGIGKRHSTHAKTFSLFNVGRWDIESVVPATFDLIVTHEWNRKEATEKNLVPPNPLPKLRPPACCDVVPILHEGPFTDAAIDATLARLRGNGSVADPSCKKPEGIIVYHTASGKMFKVTLENDESPKGKL